MPGAPSSHDNHIVPRHLPSVPWGQDHKGETLLEGVEVMSPGSPCCHVKYPGACSPQDFRIRAMGYRGGGGSGSCVLQSGEGALGGFLAAGTQ